MRLEAKETFFFLCKKFYFGKFQIGMEVGWRKIHGKTSSTHYLHSAANIVLNAHSLSRLPLLQQWMDLKMNSRLHISLARYKSFENQHFHPFNYRMVVTRKISDIVLTSSNLHYNQLFLFISNVYVDLYAQIRIQSPHVAVILNLLERILFKLVVNVHFKANILYGDLTRVFHLFYCDQLYWFGNNRGSDIRQSLSPPSLHTSVICF